MAMVNVLKLKKVEESVVTVDDLAKAIKHSVSNGAMHDEEARAIAQHVMNFFGYSERIIDNMLEPEDRDAFYILEDSGLLTTEREETTLYDGREWRIHYWLFKKEKIFEMAEEQRKKEAEEDDESRIYEELPDDVWFSREEL